MPSSRIKNSLKNVIYGVVILFLTLCVNLVTRIFIVRLLGREINGLNGLFTEVIAMLSLAEMGVGSAITFSLYKPLSIGDEKKISQLMWLFKISYRVISIIILLLGVMLTPFIQSIVKETTFNNFFIQQIFLLFVLKTSSTYLFSYKTSLLIADQKNYIVSLITIIYKIVLTLSAIAIFYLTKSFSLYLIASIISNFAINITISIYVDKKYEFLNKKDKLPKDECKKIFNDIKNAFVSKVSGVITNSTDNILISVLVNIVSVGMYSNYALITTNVKLLFSQVSTSILGSIGNLIAVEDSNHCDKVLKRLNFAFFVAALICAGGVYCCASLFVEICFGKENIIGNSIVFVCAYNLFLYILTLPLWNMISVSGLFSEDKKISITGTVINLIVSFFVGRYIGMLGIFIGTTCTTLIQVFLKIFLLYKKKFKIPERAFLIESIKMLVIASLALLLQSYICSFINFNSLFLMFIVKGIVSVMISITIIIIIYSKTYEFKYFIELLKKDYLYLINKIT